MSQYPDPAPYGAYEAYGGSPVRRPRRRPSPAWLVLGAALLVVGLGLAVPALVLSVAAFTQVEARIPADGVARTVRVEPGTVHLLWRRPADTPDCRVVEGDDLAELPLRGLGATTYTRDLGDGEWVSARTFTPTSDRVEITCSPGSNPVEVGEKPRVHTLVGGVLLGLVVPILLALAGFVLLVVTGVLLALGPAVTPADAPRPGHEGRRRPDAAPS